MPFRSQFTNNGTLVINPFYCFQILPSLWMRLYHLELVVITRWEESFYSSPHLVAELFKLAIYFDGIHRYITFGDQTNQCFGNLEL